MIELAAPESIYEALKRAVDALGGAKKAGNKLRPYHNDARGWLLNCLNPEHPQKLDPEQVIHLLRLACEIGHHESKHYLDRVTGYAPTAPLAIEAQLATALTEVRALRNSLEEKQRDLETLANNPRLLATMRAANLKVDAA